MKVIRFRFVIMIGLLLLEVVVFIVKKDNKVNVFNYEEEKTLLI